MNKKYILLFVGVIVVFIIFVIVIFLRQGSSQVVPKPASLQNQNPAKLQPNQGSAAVSSVPAVSSTASVTLQPPASTPKEAARQFYNYYFSSATNPLAAGAYKNNPYLSQDFKDVVGSLYNDGNAPVFCSQNKRVNITVGKEVQIYYNNQYLRQEIISETPPGTKDLYSITLENVNGKWLVFDVNCLY